MPKLLSICIPTYNRKEKLVKLVGKLINQIEKNNVDNDVEIYISDNASTDKTSEYLDGLSEVSYIRIHRYVINTGMEGNFKQCYHAAQGKYVIVISDDDEYDDDLIKNLIEAIKKYPSVDYFFIPSKQSRDYSNIRFREINRLTFLQETGMGCALLGSNVFRTSIIQEEQEKSVWYQCALLFNSNINECCVLDSMIDIKMPDIEIDKNYWANHPYKRMDYDCQIIKLINESLMSLQEKNVLLDYYREGFFMDEIISFLHSEYFDKEKSLVSGKKIQNVEGFNREAFLLLNARRITEIGYKLYMCKKRCIRIVARKKIKI